MYAFSAHDVVHFVFERRIIENKELDMYEIVLLILAFCKALDGVLRMDDWNMYINLLKESRYLANRLQPWDIVYQLLRHAS